ncbi:hypothetical protein [Methylocystis iwaonis]|uniref:hypothetical protein n=1 Tax=Methylocystis iwaonis TaxID=2885079 RepID=UPI002E7B440B|nr:hypothetical protein [Methylocystis iwaonis]
MTRAARKIPIDAQITAVSQSAEIARAASEFRGESVMAARAVALDAAVRTLEAVRDHADAFRFVLQKTAAKARGEGGVGEKARHHFSKLPLAQQATMRCGDPRFQRFLKVDDVDWAAIAVRRACHVESRKELDAVAEAGNAWRKLDAEFEAWLRGVDGGETP